MAKSTRPFGGTPSKAGKDNDQHSLRRSPHSGLFPFRSWIQNKQIRADGAAVDVLSQPFIAPSTFLQLGPDRLIASFTAAAPAGLAGLVANLVLQAWRAPGTRRGLARKTRGSRLPRQKDWRPVGVRPDRLRPAYSDYHLPIAALAHFSGLFHGRPRQPDALTRIGQRCPTFAAQESKW